jgi:hypothetical protein
VELSPIPTNPFVGAVGASPAHENQFAVAGGGFTHPYKWAPIYGGGPRLGKILICSRGTLSGCQNFEVPVSYPSSGLSPHAAAPPLHLLPTPLPHRATTPPHLFSAPPPHAFFSRCAPELPMSASSPHRASRATSPHAGLLPHVEHLTGLLFVPASSPCGALVAPSSPRWPRPHAPVDAQ